MAVSHITRDLSGIVAATMGFGACAANITEPDSKKDGVETWFVISMMVPLLVVVRGIVAFVSDAKAI